MLKKIKGFKDTAEAQRVMDAIRQRADGADLFARHQPSTKPSPQVPSF
ncbi:MAG: hypothetical protein HY052_02720 [Proteobacteria bacterium]|nr:hypothetical protein [Pseudomonadota bacterium]